ncbi:hypothetical protein F5Y05DRAFT_18937 [Hypoxylon sp. FL0543]|nr:hypothetical protein F5Y05DRAFT_18937 [Hypoxylon sp. FL0543]
MDSLPEEIIDIVVSFLPKGRFIRLASFATLSTLWQKAIERRTFSYIAISSEDEDIQNFTRIVTPARRAFLRYLKFTVIVPLVGLHVKRDSSQEPEPFNEPFTSAMHRLFQLLADKESNDVDERARTCNLILEVGEVTHYGEKQLRPRQHIDLLHGGRRLPEVNCVSRLVLYRAAMERGRRVSLRTAVGLAQRLPCLRRVDIIANELELSEMVGQAGALHLGDREALATALVESNFLSALRHCKEVCLRLEEQDPIVLSRHSRLVLPNYTNPLSFEALGSAMRTWSHNLVSLEIGGVFDGTLFWPSEHEPSAVPASPWPRLRNFHAGLELATPTGAWYFVPRSERGPRDVPSEETMQPLFESWAKALESMPILEHASIRFLVELETPALDYVSQTSAETWAVGFHAPGIPRGPRKYGWEWTGLGENHEADYSQSPRLVFRSVDGWRPQRAVMDKLHALGVDRFLSRNMVDLEVDMFGNVIEA